MTLFLTLEGPCIIFCNIYTFQRDTQCSTTDCLLMLRCQLYMFRTVTVHPQELLFRCCMCRLWYVLIRPAGTTFEEELSSHVYYLRIRKWTVCNVRLGGLKTISCTYCYAVYFTLFEDTCFRFFCRDYELLKESASRTLHKICHKFS